MKQVYEAVEVPMKVEESFLLRLLTERLVVDPEWMIGHQGSHRDCDKYLVAMTTETEMSSEVKKGDSNDFKQSH